MFFKIGALKNFANFTGKHLCWSLFLVKFLTNFIKGTPTQVFSCEIWKNYKNTFSTEHLQWLLLSKETSAQVCLPVKFTKFLRTPFFTEHLRWLLLNGSFSLVRLCNNKNQHYFLLIFLPVLIKILFDSRILFPELVRERKHYLLGCNLIFPFKTILLLIIHNYTEHIHLQLNFSKKEK